MKLLKVPFRDVLSYHVTTTFQSHLFAFPFSLAFMKAYSLKLVLLHLSITV